MKASRTLLLTTLAAFAGGFTAGIFYQTDPCRRFRSTLGTSAREHTRWIDDQLRGLERQLTQVEEQLHVLGEEFGERLRETVNQYVPDMDVDEDSWQVQRSEVAHELPRMPR